MNDTGNWIPVEVFGNRMATKTKPGDGAQYKVCMSLDHSLSFPRDFDRVIQSPNCTKLIFDDCGTYAVGPAYTILSQLDLSQSASLGRIVVNQQSSLASSKTLTVVPYRLSGSSVRRSWIPGNSLPHVVYILESPDNPAILTTQGQTSADDAFNSVSKQLVGLLLTTWNCPTTLKLPGVLEFLPRGGRSGVETMRTSEELHEKIVDLVDERCENQDFGLWTSSTQKGWMGELYGREVELEEMGDILKGKVASLRLVGDPWE